MDYKAFSAAIKKKYPQYSGIDDFGLASMVVQKHPEYKQAVNDWSGTPWADNQGIQAEGPVEAMNGVVNKTAQGLQDVSQGAANVSAGSDNPFVKAGAAAVGVPAQMGSEYLAPTTRMGQVAQGLGMALPFATKGVQAAGDLAGLFGKGVKQGALKTAESAGTLSDMAVGALKKDMPGVLNNPGNFEFSNGIHAKMGATEPLGDMQQVAEGIANQKAMTKSLTSGKPPTPTQPSAKLLTKNNVLDYADYIANKPDASYAEAFNAKRALNDLGDSISTSQQKMINQVPVGEGVSTKSKLNNIMVDKLKSSPETSALLDHAGVSPEDFIHKYDAQTKAAQELSNWTGPKSGSGNITTLLGAGGGYGLGGTHGAEAVLGSRAALEAVRSPKVLGGAMRLGQGIEDTGQGLAKFLSQDISAPDVSGSLAKVASDQRGAINPSGIPSKLDEAAYDAKFLGASGPPGEEPQSLFNVTKEGHPLNGSSVSANTLIKHGLEPQFPDVSKEVQKMLSQGRSLEDVESFIHQLQVGHQDYANASRLHLARLREENPIAAKQFFENIGK